MPADRTSALSSGISRAARAVADALALLPAPGMIIGGVAVILHGVPRVTRDVDATVDGGSIGLDDLLRHLVSHEITQRIPDAIDFAAANQVLLLRHEPTRIDVDLSLAWLPFELEAIASREHLERGEVRADIATPEDLIIYKAIAWRPQDQQDVERLLTLHAQRIDLSRVRSVVGELAAAIDEAERLSELERLIARVG